MIEDAMNTEALACVAVHHFYNDQPEIALRYYRYEHIIMHDIGLWNIIKILIISIRKKPIG